MHYERRDIEVAMQRLKNAPGIDNISAQLHAAGNRGVEMMFKFCSKVWEEETFRQV